MASDSGDAKAPDGADDDQPKGFLKPPLEIRVKIYELLLLPPPAKRVECCGSPGTKLCSPGGRLLASTCKPTSSSIRTFACPTCIWRGADVHTDILAVNRQISNEAGAVLYENTRLVIREGPRCSSLLRGSEISPLAYVNIKHLQLSIETPTPDTQRYVRLAPPSHPWAQLARYCAWGPPHFLKSLKHVTLHFDVDLTNCDRLDAQPFLQLVYLTGVDWLVEVHIIRGLEGDDDFAEVIETRPRDQKAAKWLDDRAEQLRADFVRDLGWVFEANGQELKLRSE